MKHFLLTLLLLIGTASLWAQTNETPTKRSAIGIGGGYDGSYGTFIGEVYYQRDIQIFRKDGAMRFGLTTHTYQLEAFGVHDLDARSVGLFGDLVLYPGAGGFYIGVRWEGINLNWLSGASKRRLLANQGHSMGVYSGTSFFLQAGYDVKFSPRWGLNIYAQPGVQEYSITKGNSMGNYTDAEDGLMKSKVKFVYNLNLGLYVRL